MNTIYLTQKMQTATIKYMIHIYMKCHYRIDLEGSGWFATDYAGSYKLADGYTYTTNYGTINKNTYNVNIGTNDDMAPSGQQIRGNGTIYQ